METAQAEIPKLSATTALKVPWRDAAREIQSHLKIGRAIKNQRIRDQWELDQARTEKNEWLGRTSDLLNRIFTNPAVAERCNDVTPPVLPEYAEFDLFADQFHADMTQRLARLGDVLAQLDSFPEATPEQIAEIHAAEAADLPAGVTDQVAAPVPEPEAAPVTVTEQPATTQPASAPPPPVVQVRRPPIQKPVAPSRPKQTNKPARQPATSPEVPDMIATQSASTSSEFANGNGRNSASPRISMPHTDVTVAGLLIATSADDPATNVVHEFLRDLGFNMTIIDRRGGGGAEPASITEETAVTKDSSFAVVVAGANPASSPEWLFDLGFCAGRLGAERVCIVHNDAQPTADRHGITHLGLDEGGGWQLHLARHLRRAGVPLDLNRLA